MHYVCGNFDYKYSNPTPYTLRACSCGKVFGWSVELNYNKKQAHNYLQMDPPEQVVASLRQGMSAYAYRRLTALISDESGHPQGALLLPPGMKPMPKAINKALVAIHTAYNKHNQHTKISGLIHICSCGLVLYGSHGDTEPLWNCLEQLEPAVVRKHRAALLANYRYLAANPELAYPLMQACNQKPDYVTQQVAHKLTWIQENT
jgi:hypothetical protein